MITLQNYEIEKQNEVLYYITVPFSPDFPLLKVNFDIDSEEVEAGGNVYTVNDCLVSDNGEWINLVCDRIKEVVSHEKEERKRIGNEIAEARKRYEWVDDAGIKRTGMTQAEMAEKVGISQNHISRIEHGAYSSQFDTLEAMAEAVGCKLKIV